MKLIKLQLLSKNNKKRGKYYYSPIVQVNGKYYRCVLIESTAMLRNKDIDVNKLIVTSEILPQYYAANGLQ